MIQEIKIESEGKDDRCYEKSRKDTYSKSSYSVGKDRRGLVMVEATLAVSEAVVILEGVEERDRLQSEKEELLSDESGV